jgi:hypothetical protein
MQAHQHKGDDDIFSPGWEGQSPASKMMKKQKIIKDEVKIKLQLSGLIISGGNDAQSLNSENS